MTKAEAVEAVKELLDVIGLSGYNREDVIRKIEYSGNRVYKDNLFVYLFGNEKYKRFTLELYNAINGTNYTDADEVEITTLENVVYINVKNDLSFLLSGKMNFYEHQSTYNPNIPVRMLIYSAKVYDRYIFERKYNIYGSSKFEIPVPKCICFYNGNKNMEDVVKMRLSDSMPGEDKGDIDVTVTALNINSGHNAELMKASRTLGDYSVFVEKVREYSRETENLKKAIDRAISEMPEDSEVGEILRNNRSEVVSMCLEEYTQEYADELHRIELEEQKNRAIMLEVKLGESETKVEDLEVKLSESESKVEKLEFERNQAMAELAAIKAQYGIK